MVRDVEAFLVSDDLKISLYKNLNVTSCEVYMKNVNHSCFYKCYTFF